MPLRKGSGKDVLKFNIGELMRSSTFGEGKSRKKKREMSVAAAYRQQRESKRKKR